jgi:hypothetical protein
MKILNKNWPALAAICASILIAVATALTALSQTAPTLTIASTGTNQMSVTISNNIGTSDYDLEWTPILGNANYPWTFAAVGVPGGTNFVVGTAGYPAGFYRVILDSNTVPLWESADPNNPASPILNVTIASPKNGSTLN